MASRVTFEGNYVRMWLDPAVVIDHATALALLLEAIRLCGTHLFLRILIEAENVTSQLDERTVEDIVKRAALVSGLKLGCFIGAREPSSLDQHFAKIVGQHGATVRFFHDREDALRWLGAK